MASSENAHIPKVALLTAGRDRPYAFGMGTALMTAGISVDIIGASDLDHPQWYGKPHIRFLNLRGDLSGSDSLIKKVLRVLSYYVRLMAYTATSKAKLFHILWNNKFETFDRVPLMLYYRLFGKRLLLTVHNVNAGERDANDSWFNRLTLRTQYKLSDHLFVHTNRMKTELVQQFGVLPRNISVIPFGINNAVPHTELLPQEARRWLGIEDREHVLLFFGNIAPYKGLEYLVEAFRLVMDRGKDHLLIIAGNPKNCAVYWDAIRKSLERHPYCDRILQKIEFIPDEETEIYFKAADVLVLPYRHVYQSGVLFLGYSFGLPVIASDVGNLREDIVEGKTGLICRPDSAEDLANIISTFFSSDMYHRLNECRKDIQEYARRWYSWDVVGNLTVTKYKTLSRDSP